MKSLKALGNAHEAAFPVASGVGETSGKCTWGCERTDSLKLSYYLSIQFFFSFYFEWKGTEEQGNPFCFFCVGWSLSHLGSRYLPLPIAFRFFSITFISCLAFRMEVVLNTCKRIDTLNICIRLFKASLTALSMHVSFDPDNCPVYF